MQIPDLFKIGVFMLGIAALVFAAMAVHWYYVIQTSYGYYSQADFSAYCTNNSIIISAQKDLSDVKVADQAGNAVCSFGGIRRGSDEVCSVGLEGIFTVTVQDEKKAVVCEELKAVYSQQVTAD